MTIGLIIAVSVYLLVAATLTAIGVVRILIASDDDWYDREERKEATNLILISFVWPGWVVKRVMDAFRERNEP